MFTSFYRHPVKYKFCIYIIINLSNFYIVGLTLLTSVANLVLLLPDPDPDLKKSDLDPT